MTPELARRPSPSLSPPPSSAPYPWQANQRFPLVPTADLAFACGPGPAPHHWFVDPESLTALAVDGHCVLRWRHGAWLRPPDILYCSERYEKLVVFAFAGYAIVLERAHHRVVAVALDAPGLAPQKRKRKRGGRHTSGGEAAEEGFPDESSSSEEEEDEDEEDR